MGLMTASQYRNSLKDNRVVYMCGERVENVATHSTLKACVDTAALDYEMAETAKYRDLAVVADPKTGEPISRYYHTPTTGEDLLKRHELMIEATRFAKGITTPFSHDIASDAMNAVKITTRLMGKKEYIERAEGYCRHLQNRDLAVACAVTDAKGDRTLRPSSSDQRHPDYYVHVVDKCAEGITVRGAKAHITGAAYFNEFFVLPGRSMTKEDSDYAIAFALPVDTKGVTQVCHPINTGSSPLDFPAPWACHTDSLIIFDNVFVPWERVFLCGEWQFAKHLVYNFACFHRLTAVSYRIPISELMLGMAQAMAEYNGIENVPYIREEITDLSMYVRTLKSLGRAACTDCVAREGIAVPNPSITNMAKYHFASNYHECVRAVQDIAGAIVATAPTYKDYLDADIGRHISRYLGGKPGQPTEHRLRMVQLIRRLLTAEYEVLAIHGEGSFQAERMAIRGEEASDIQRCKEMAISAAGIR